MKVELLTKDDLIEFKTELLEEIKCLIQPTSPSAKWLRSSEVKKILNISAGTLQNLRVNGTLHPVKLSESRIWYYNSEEINKLFQLL